MSQQFKEVQLVLPEGMRPEPVAAKVEGSSWVIAVLVGVVVVGNAVLVWWRIKGRDPLKRAFEGAAGRAGLNKAERKRVVELAAGKMEPVAMLVCESALEGAGDDPVVVSVRRKVRAV